MKPNQLIRDFFLKNENKLKSIKRFLTNHKKIRFLKGILLKQKIFSWI